MDRMNRMIILSKTPSSRTMRQLFGCVLCMLVIFFSVSVKVAMSQPGRAQKPFASVKLRQRNPDLGLSSNPQVLVTAVLLVFGCIALVCSLALGQLRLVIELSAPTLQCWFSPYLAVRPPPSI